MPLETLRPDSLVQRAVDGMRSMLDSGEWVVGTRIPSELALAQTLGVSRNTVREAVRALAHVGVLEVRRGSGTFVLATTEVQALMERQLERHEPQHLLEVRHALEVLAVQLAAQRRTDHDLAIIDEIAQRRSDALIRRDRDDFVGADVALHMAVVEAAHNPILVALYSGLVDTLRSSILSQDDGDGFPPPLDEEHDAMVAAVRSGDPAAAAEATTRLLRHLGLEPAD